MPRLIFKCPHIKGGESAAAHLSNYIKYAATREGVEQIAKRENYVDYIANRPRAQKNGAHGLFTNEDEPLVLSRIASEVAHHPGTVWLPILSLRREDAQRLGYDNAQRWRELISEFAPKLAEAMKIPLSQFRWYAAYHDEGHHPHVHMVVYSADGKSGFLTRQGIEKIKSELVNEIFCQELTEIYQRQTMQRDELTRQSRERMKSLIREMDSGMLENQRMARLLVSLAQQLQTVGGRKQYGYLKAPLKVLVDEIVDELAGDPRVAQAYALWYEQREEILLSYKDDLPERLPLSQQKELKQIKNMVIQEAVKMNGPRPPEPAQEPDPAEELTPSLGDPDIDRILVDSSPTAEQIQIAVERLTKAANAGQDCAQYALGKLYRDGIGVEKDMLQAVAWFALAAEQDNSYAAYALGKLYLESEEVPKDMDKALRWLRRSAELGNQFAQYQLGRLLLAGEDVPKDIDEAVRLLSASAEQGNQYAQYQLGKLYLLGQEVERDEETAVQWFKLSADQGNEYAQWFLDHLHEFRGPTPAQCVIRLLHHMSRIFQEQSQRQAGMRMEVDRKLRQKIREKKIAMGHKADDHIEYQSV